MPRVIRGNGIKLLDDHLETASFRILIGIYIGLVNIKDCDDLDEVLFVFREYIYKEYERLYIVLKQLDKVKHYNMCPCMEERIELYKNQGILITPSEILNELQQIKKFKNLVQVQEETVQCLPCKKLK
jgi:hypothetical protein